MGRLSCVCYNNSSLSHRTAEYESRMRGHWQLSQNPSPEQLKELEVRNTRRGNCFSWDLEGLGARGAGTWRG